MPLFPFLLSNILDNTLALYFCSVPTATYGQAASSLVAVSNLEQTIQQIMDMGGGSWDRETVTHALQAAYNNPERAVDYLYSVCLNWLMIVSLSFLFYFMDFTQPCHAVQSAGNS